MMSYKKYPFRYVLFLLALLSVGPLQAQNGFNMPYSMYSLGESTMPMDMPFSGSMGGLYATQAGYNFINPFNPASTAAIESESFVFDLGFSLQMRRLKDEYDQLKDFDGVISYLALGFPITRWWKTSIGLLPIGDVSYQITDQLKDPLTYISMKTIYEGSGGVNRVFWNHGFNITPHLSAGFGASFVYGDITRAITYDFDGNDTTYYINSRRQRTTTIRRFLFDVGAQYCQPLSEDYQLHLGFTCQLPMRWSVYDDALAYTFVKTTSELFLDTIFPARGENSEYTSTIDVPLKFTFGVSLERNDLWMVGFDMTVSQWSGFKYEEGIENPLFGSDFMRYQNNYRFALGGGWLGDKQSSSYWGRIGVSAGLFYERGKVCLEYGESTHIVNEYGGGLGFTLPMRKGRSILRLDLTYSRMGDVTLLQRDFLSIGLCLSTSDRWFVKRKYN